ncbi:MAG: hypothetical protein ABSH20_14290, partial [Tepidisphaeraceae bacterium]
MKTTTTLSCVLVASGVIALALVLWSAQVAHAADEPAAADTANAGLARLAGQPADVAPSAYSYRADRKAMENPPESWLLLMQYASLPFDKPVDVNASAVRKVLCGALWEEVRPVRRVELSWPMDAREWPSPEQVVLSYFDATDGTAHTWWNPRSIKEAVKPIVSADRHTYIYTIPVDTWGVVAAVRGDKDALAYAVPSLCAIVPDVWKQMDLEIEWGFDDATAPLVYDGRVEAYDGIIGGVKPLAGDVGTAMVGPLTWRSAGNGDARRGVRLSVLYMGTSRWRRIWPYHAQPEDVARTILTVWTKSGSFSFQVSDLEMGPILAPEFGFFVRGTTRPQTATGPATPTRFAVPAMQTMGQKVEALPGVPKVRGWAINGMPWFGVSSSNESGTAGS